MIDDDPGLPDYEVPTPQFPEVEDRHPLDRARKLPSRKGNQRGLRFAVRWSNAVEATDCAVPVRAVDEAVNAIVCPEQTGKVDGCGKCGLCWGTRRNIAFLEH